MCASPDFRHMLNLIYWFDEVAKEANGLSTRRKLGADPEGSNVRIEDDAPRLLWRPRFSCSCLRRRSLRFGGNPRGERNSRRRRAFARKLRRPNGFLGRAADAWRARAGARGSGPV